MEYEEVTKRLRNIIESPIRKISPDYIEFIIKDYNEKRQKSKEHYELAKELIPGGLEHNLSLKWPFPITMNKADGAYLWDIDGNKYIDYLSMGGPIILGHNYPLIRDNIIELIKEKGPATGVTSEWETKTIKEIKKHMPSIERFRFHQSGTEANISAFRVARTFTEKKYIVKIGGSYHGWSSEMVYDMHIPGTRSLEAHGIPKAHQKYVKACPPNDEKKMKRIFKKAEKKGGVAAVIVEALGGESGTHPVKPGWNKFLREICDEYGSLLIFDEVVTAFRLSMGGAQEYFNVRPDLTTFGKIIGHGYPSCGGIGGRKDIMAVLAGGIEGMSKKAYTGGTLAANPITAMAAYYAIKEIKRTNAVEKTGRAGDRLINGINELFEKYELPFVAWNYKSILHVETGAPLALRMTDHDFLNQLNERKKLMDEFGAALNTQGINVLAGSRGYTTLSHTDDIIDETLKAYDEVLKWFI
ncbi:MAG: aminotransferase class III-fold pyridoxal phosphate-dependent enzyme [Candidatus Lokiarchaeota archaeon]|nr:aminotransferase class III-fold pyridoxal phosphate-dependent enzyme [Candidatus Lokiarchaeota archaeon]